MVCVKRNPFCVRTKNIHTELNFTGGSIRSHQWIRIPEPLIQTPNLFSVDNLHVTGRLYFAYIDFVMSKLTNSQYLPPEAIIKTRLGHHILLWFSGIWASASANKSILTLELHKGAIVNSNHYDEGKFSLFYQLQNTSGTDTIEFHIELSQFHSRIRGDKIHAPYRYILYRMTQGAVHRFITVGFIKRIATVLQNRKTSLKKLFGVSDETFLFWMESGQISAEQTLINFTDRA